VGRWGFGRSVGGEEEGPVGGDVEGGGAICGDVGGEGEGVVGEVEVDKVEVVAEVAEKGGGGREKDGEAAVEEEVELAGAVGDVQDEVGYGVGEVLLGGGADGVIV
jgi:hypothetical protein